MDDKIASAQAFYKALAADNTKAWWEANRATYDTDLRPAALALLERLAPQITDLTGLPAVPKLFRPHRDVRFSKDKTPYKTHLHMLWRLDSGAPQDPVFFFGIGLEGLTVGAGLPSFDKPVLDNWRSFADLDTARITGLLEAAQAKGYAPRPPALKRIPSAYDKDHPGADLLRHKGLILTRDIPRCRDSDLMAAFADLWPINALLIQVAEA